MDVDCIADFRVIASFILFLIDYLKDCDNRRLLDIYYENP